MLKEDKKNRGVREKMRPGYEETKDLDLEDFMDESERSKVKGKTENERGNQKEARGRERGTLGSIEERESEERAKGSNWPWERELGRGN